MGERDSWAVGSDTDRRVDVEDARIAIGALWTPDGSNIRTRAGFRPGPAAGRVTASTPTADKNVHVEAFSYVMPASRGVGPYIISNDAPKTMDILASNPADSSNPRWDLIIAQQSDTFYGDTSSDMTVKHIVGTPSPTPSDPPVPGSPDYVELARVRVGAGVNAITGADIDDLRPLPLYTVAVGGTLPIGSATERAAIIAPHTGMKIVRTDWGWEEMWDGAAWRVISQIAVANAAALTSGITSPYEGLLAYVRDVDLLYAYDGTSWGPVHQQKLAMAAADIPSMGSSGGVVTLAFNATPARNDGFVYASPYNSFTIPVDGEFDFFLQGTFASSTGGTERRLHAVIGGVTYIDSRTPVSGDSTALTATWRRYVTANTTVQFGANQNSGGNLAFTSIYASISRVA